MKSPKPERVYATVPKLWANGATCVVLGSGPSLTKDDVRYAQRQADGLIAVNDSYLYAPDATALYAADAKWLMTWHHGCEAAHVTPNGKHYPAFTGQYKFTLAHITRPGISVLRKGPETGISTNPEAVSLGRNGVYQAVNVAIHFGATRIVLLGVDMKDPQRHMHGRHPDNSGPPVATCMERFATMVKPLEALGVEVINCTRDTALKCFPLKSLDEVFQCDSDATASTEHGQQASHV